MKGHLVEVLIDDAARGQRRSHELQGIQVQVRRKVLGRADDAGEDAALALEAQSCRRLEGCKGAGNDQGTLLLSSNVTLTSAVFPGATSIGSGFGGFTV